MSGQYVPMFREFSVNLQKVSTACVDAPEKVHALFSIHKINGDDSPFSIGVFRKKMIDCDSVRYCSSEGSEGYSQNPPPLPWA